MENISSLRWAGFEKAKGWDGLNNAAINSFNSNIIDSFIREMFQNSNDARQKDGTGTKKKLKVEIGFKKIGISEFPDFSNFFNIINVIAKEPENQDHEKFFSHALREFGSDGTVPIFIYKDYNTSGLSGTDDDAKSSFSACVLSEGVTVKGDKTAGGSYGIGKNAIYGFSKLRTVLYSSLNVEGEKIFQGLSKLASYRMDDKTREYRIFFGDGINLSSIRNFDLLPDDLRKLVERTEPGLTQIAICPIESSDWVKDFTKAILRNYWLLIDNDQLEVNLHVDESSIHVINKDNLVDLMQRYYNPENFNPEINSQGNPYDFFHCYKDQNAEERAVHMLGNMKFYYQELSHKKTNAVAFIRNGMLIFSEPIWGFGSIGYCGVVVCDDEAGNVILRMMEPPTHDKFDPSRLTDRAIGFDEKDGIKALDQTRRLIRDCLNKISDKYRKKAEEIPWLNNLLSSIKGHKGGGKGNRTGEESEKETIDRVSTDKRQTLIFNSVTRNAVISSKEGEKDGPGGGSNPRTPHPPGPANPNPGPNPNPNVKNPVTKINARIFKSGKIGDESQYKILLATNTNLTGKSLKLFQVGDSGNAACFEIIKITDLYDNNILFEKILNKNDELVAYKLKDISMPNELSLHIMEPYKSTFKLQEL